MGEVRHHRVCVICGRPPEEVGPLSSRGKCLADANYRVALNHLAMTTRSGPYWKLWRERMAASVGATIPASRSDVESD